MPLVELYEPSAGTFALVGNMLHGSDGPTATLLADGRVLLAGGTGEHREFDPHAEVYVPGS